MLKQDITYENFAGETVTETHYFNISRDEVLAMEMEENLEGGFTALIEKIRQSEDGKQLLPAFEDLVRRSYGVRSADGRKFYKTSEAWTEFKASGAYGALFILFMTKDNFASDFVNGVFPQSGLDTLGEEVARTALAAQRRQAEQRRAQPQDHLPRQEALENIAEPETVRDSFGRHQSDYGTVKSEAQIRAEIEAEYRARMGRSLGETQL